MAEQPVIPAQQLEQLLKCPICLDRYRKPKLLPCQHTFCEVPCLQNLLDASKRIRCPECRADHFVPLGLVSRLPNNLTIVGFLDLHSQLVPRPNQSNSPESHADSEEEITANGRCEVCTKVTILQLCSHCCKQTCENCRNSHRNQIKLDIARNVNQLRRSLPKYREAISAIDTRRQTTLDDCQGCKGEIHKAVWSLINEMKEREELLLAEVDGVLRAESRTLDLQKENLELELQTIVSFCDAAETLLTRDVDSGDQELARAYSDTISHLDEVQIFSADQFSAPSKAIKFKSDQPTLSALAANFGEIIVCQPNNVSYANRPRIMQISSPSQAYREYRLNNTSPRQPPISHQNTVNIPRANNSPRNVNSNNNSLPSVSPRSETNTSPRRYHGSLNRPSITTATRRTRSMSNSGSVNTSLPNGTNRHSIGAILPALTSGVSSSNTSPRHHDNHSNLGLSSSLNTTATTARQNLSSLFVSAEAAFGPATTATTTTPNNHNSHSTSTNRETFSRHSFRQGRRSRSSESVLLAGASNHTTVASESHMEALPLSLSRSGTYVVAPSEDSSNGDSGQNDTNNGTLSNHGTVRSPVSFHIPVDEIESPQSSTQSELEVNVQRSRPRRTGAQPRIAYTSKGRMLLQLGGERGSLPGQFTWPRGVAVSPDGNRIIVADSSNHRLQLFDSSGRLESIFGRYGQGEGEFDCLAGVAVNTMGQIIVSDRYNHRIQILDRSGEFVSQFNGLERTDARLCYPWGVATDTMGFIYVCDKDSNCIKVFQLDGSYVRKFGEPGCGNGQFNHPHYITVSSDNRLIISDSNNHRVQVFDHLGHHLFTFGTEGSSTGQFRFPRGVAVDQQGYIVVADSGNNRIQVFRPDGTYYTTFGCWGSWPGQMKGVEGIALTPQGQIIVSDRENHRVQIF